MRELRKPEDKSDSAVNTTQLSPSLNQLSRKGLEGLCVWVLYFWLILTAVLQDSVMAAAAL